MPSPANFVAQLGKPCLVAWSSLDDLCMIELSAKPLADKIQSKIKDEILIFKKQYNRPPTLSVILVGQDPASVIYTNRKGKMALSLGMNHETIVLSERATPKELQELVHQLNENPMIDGILIQRPLPSHFKEEEVLSWVSPAKDVDAFHPMNAGKLYLGLKCLKPCTPSGIIELLNYYSIPIEGKLVCVIGRSSIVGKPMAALLLQANATVIQCHSRTKKLSELTRQADILIVAAGKMQLIDRSYIKNQTVIIDVGMHRDKMGKLKGDVNYEDVHDLVSAITPVPGGVGPMTIAMLMQNTLIAAQERMRK